MDILAWLINVAAVVLVCAMVYFMVKTLRTPRQPSWLYTLLIYAAIFCIAVGLLISVNFGSKYSLYTNVLTFLLLATAFIVRFRADSTRR
jgi:uncharacterized membrane protein